MKGDNWILVTGGTGFIGRALTERLLTLGLHVRVITRQGNPKNLQTLQSTFPETLDIYRADITDQTQLEAAFENVSFVYHSAALVNSILAYSNFQKTNVQGTKNIVDLSRKHKVERLIYISSSDVFGIPKHGETFDESSPHKKWQEAYPDTKVEATQVVKEASDLATTIIYPGWVYGPGDRAFIPTLVGQLKYGFMIVWDKDEFRIGFTYIDDLIKILVGLPNRPETENRDYLILDDTSTTTLHQLCETLGSQHGLRFRTIRIPYRLAWFIAWFSQTLCRLKICRSLLMSTTDAKSFGHNFKFSTRKAQEEIGWKVDTKLEEGLKNWKQWWETNK